MKDITNPPALVRPATEDLAALVRQIGAEHEACLAAAHKGLEHARAAGELLSRAKKAVGHGHWLEWLEANAPFDRFRAAEYLRVYDHWDEIERECAAGRTLGLKEALRWIAGDGGEQPEAWETPAAVERPRLSTEEAAALVEDVLAGLPPEEQRQAIEEAEEHIDRRAAAADGPADPDRQRLDRALRKLDGAHRDVAGVGIGVEAALKRIKAARKAVEERRDAA